MRTVHTEETPTVLTSAGRRDLEQRLERAQAALDAVSGRLRAGERDSEEVAEQQRLLGEVEELTAVLAQAADLGSMTEDPAVVQIGDEVDVELSDGERDTFVLVHPVEASVADGRVSVASPLGKALLGARPGDGVTVDAPDGPYRCTILRFRRLS